MSSSSTANTFSGFRQDSSAIQEQSSFCLHVHARVPQADFLQLHAVSSMSPFGAGSLFMSTVSMSLSLTYHHCLIQKEDFAKAVDILPRPCFGS